MTIVITGSTVIMLIAMTINMVMKDHLEFRMLGLTCGGATADRPLVPKPTQVG